MVESESDTMCANAVGCMNFTVNFSTVKLRHTSSKKLVALLRLLETGGELRNLIVKESGIGKRTLPFLGQALQAHPTLETLAIYSINSGSWNIIKQLVRIMAKNTVLQAFLTSDSLTVSDVVLMLEALGRNPASSIRRLAITHMFRHSAEGGVKVAELLTSPSLSARIEVLDLGESRLSNIAFKILLDSLVTNRCLLDLDLRGNAIDDIVVNGMPNMLAKNRALQKLSLKGNKIRREGVKSIAAGLAKNTTLRWLDLSLNPLKAEDIAELSKGLEANHGLRFLGLNGLKFMLDQGSSVAGLFYAARHLTEVSLLESPVMRQAMKNIITALALEGRGIKARLKLLFGEREIADFVGKVRKSWIAQGASVDFNEDKRRLIMRGKDGKLVFDLEF